jgi:Flp pilus assembly pilin Flp
MMRHDLMHDVEVVGRGGATAVIGIVLAAFVSLAIGATVYDIGKWLDAW